MLLLLENCVKLFKVNRFIVERVNDKSSFIEMSYDRTTEKWYVHKQLFYKLSVYKYIDYEIFKKLLFKLT